MKALRSRTINDFLRELASAKATPGGGSVAALSGAISSDLGCMVCRLTMNKRPTDDLVGLLARFTSFEHEFLELADADVLAFSAVMDAYRMNRDDEERPVRIAQALMRATDVPRLVAEKGINLLESLRTLTPLGSKQSVSDVGVAAHLAAATVKSALLNVRINLAYMQDEAEIQKIKAIAEALEKRCSVLSGQVISSVTDRISQ